MASVDPRTTEGMVSAIGDYLQLLDEAAEPEPARLRKLAMALDRLVTVYFETCEADFCDDVDAPTQDYAALYARAGKAFPSLGYYPHVFPGGDLNEQATIADAIDDLADIARDLTEVLWYLENTGSHEANWHFRFGYQNHWGEHAHSLRAFLHSTKVCAW